MTHQISQESRSAARLAAPSVIAMSKWIRQLHRWLAATFTLTIVAVVISFALGEPIAWVIYVPLFPLPFLLFSGLYLFALPHVTKWRDARSTVPAGRSA